MREMEQRAVLNDCEQRMIDEALKRHRKIYPCSDKTDLRQCFTRDEKHYLFWFNTEDNSTHVITTLVAS